MSYRLFPVPDGFYAAGRDEQGAPTIANDLEFLLCGDSYAVDRADLGYSLRRDVLVVRGDAA